MAQVAHIRYEGGALLLPAQDPYEREVVFQEAEFCARRHGSVGVQLGRREVRISLCTAVTARAEFRFLENDFPLVGILRGEE